MRTPLIAVALVLLLPGAVSGQAAPAAGGGIRVDGDGHPYRPWDVTISTSLQVDDDMRELLPGSSGYTDWEGAWGLHVEVGRYWTSHLKTEGAAAILTSRNSYGFETLPINGRSAQASWWAHTRRGHVSGALTWQFLDNVFAHPFVTAGVRMNILDVHRERSDSAWAWDGTTYNTYTLAPIDTQAVEWQARPFVGAGYKSYFYGARTFIRSELQFGFSRRGLSRWSLGSGFGFEF